MTDRDDERALLACALAGGPAAARELLRTVRAPMLADPGLSRVWSALRRVLEAATAPVQLDLFDPPPALSAPTSAPERGEPLTALERTNPAQFRPAAR